MELPKLLDDASIIQKRAKGLALVVALFYIKR
jgi:hypothetical protein